jgi:hypothetical protein
VKPSTTLPLLVTLAVAILGYALTYRANLRLAQRKDRLDRVNRQLAELYGPLFALAHASNRAFEHFRSVHWPDRTGFFQPGASVGQHELAMWRQWVTHAFMPLNRQMVEVVVRHSDLLASWQDPAFASTAREDHVSGINFPGDALARYVDERFAALRREQAELLARVQTR